MFQPLPHLLPDSIEVVTVQLPGREDRSREEPPGDLDRLVRGCAVALRPYCTMPFAFYGHCSGALLAYEVTWTMGREYGAWPQRLIAGAQTAPGAPASGERLHELSDEELLDSVRRRGGLPEAVANNAAFTEFLLPVLRADFTLWESYEHRPRTALPVPVTVVRGRDDPLVSPGAAQAWREHTTAGATEAVVDGGHYFINDLSVESARTVADILLSD